MNIQNLPCYSTNARNRVTSVARCCIVSACASCQVAHDGKCSEFVLRVVQPALVGLVDGSISTLAPLFATAYATRNPHIALLIGVATSLGAGISMGMSEGLSDDGDIDRTRQRGTLRGAICGVATFFGGIFHTLPFLMNRFSSCFARSVCRGRRGTHAYRVDSLSLHGNAVLEIGRASRAGRLAGVSVSASRSAAPERNETTREYSRNIC